ncbi:MAG: diacylglycerol kinase family protein [Bacteroidetes bacterium]|nr:diacylglycerol kinase family protein [Bacteroidota bacterium]
MSYIKKRGLSFGFAIQGIKKALKEPNFKIEVSAAVLICMVAAYFNISKTEWCFIIACCGLVLALELINSAIERLCDLISIEIDPRIKFIKDLSAGAVLIVSVASLIMGIIIFYPYLKSFFNSYL